MLQNARARRGYKTRVSERPSTDFSLKKRILRTVLEEIVVDLSEEPREIRMWMHWVGGIHTELTIPRNRSGSHGRCTDREVVDLVRELARVSADANIASILNRLGYRTGAGNTWTEARVRSLRGYQKIPVCQEPARRPWITLREASTLLGISHTATRRLRSGLGYVSLFRPRTLARYGFFCPPNLATNPTNS
jgi:hypothetical protein